MPLPIMRQCRYAARVVLTALIAVGMTACAEEPPAERYTGDIEAAQEQERLSLKDTWDNGTTVQRAEPLPARMVDIPPPRTEPAPAVTVRPRIAAPAPPTAPAPVLPAMPKAKPSPPDLAISAPPAPRQSPAPPPAPSKALTEGELERDTTRCGVGVDCLAVLRAMLADPKQSWMMRAPTPMEFSNGTRLFAYRALRRKLDCGKLRFAGAEIDWALDTFSREVEGMAAEQRARVAALAGEVREELDAEVKQRC
jgi:hypothetical protein